MIEKIILGIYSALLRCYPRDVREEFGAEMRHVFRQALAEAQARGWLHVISRAAREYRDGLLWALGQHWSAIRQRLLRAGFTWRQISGPPNLISGRWRAMMQKSTGPVVENPGQALWAAAPPALFGLGISLNSLVRGGPWYTLPQWRLLLSIGIGLTPMLFIGGVGTLALIRRLPDRFWLWVGTAYMGFTLSIKTLSEERAEVGQAMLTPSLDIALTVVVLLFGVGLMIWAASRGFRQAGLLGIGLSGTLGLSFFLAVTAAPFYRHDLALLAAPVGVLFSSMAYAFMRGSPAAQLGVLAGVLAVNIGAIAMAMHGWGDGLGGQGRGNPLVPLIVLSAGLLLISPLLQMLRGSFERLSGST